AHDAVGTLTRDQIDQEAVEGDDAKVAELRGGLVDHLEPLLHREERLLRRIGDDRDDELVEDLQAALDDVDVAVVRGIEHAGIDGALGHGGRLPSGSKESQGRLPETTVAKGAQYAPFRKTSLGQVLHDDKSLRRDQRAVAKGGERALAVVGGVRRVEEHDVEPPALVRQSPELPG